MRTRPLLASGATAFLMMMATPTPPAGAAGVVTHAWMADEAIALVQDPALAALLRGQAAAVRSGAEFPDGGYATRAAGVPGGDYGEEAHWARFHDAYLRVLRSRSGCGELTRADGPCASQVAHLLGMVAHGVGDEVWDWLFEPAATDHGELWIPPELVGVIGTGGIEVQMDAVAINDHGRPTAPGPAPADPGTTDLLAAFAGAGLPGIQSDALVKGRDAMEQLRALEASGAPNYRDALPEHMPWTSSHIVDAPGGVRFAARSIAAAWDHLWARLRGETPPTVVAATAPADGETDVPTTGWLRDKFHAGARAEGGGARNRIVAVLSYSLPYRAAGAPADEHRRAELHPGSLTLTERDTGRVVPAMTGYPRLVPYDPDYGGHLAGFQPAEDLHPCTWYQVSTTDRLQDAGDRAVAPTTWTFRTDGCPTVAPTTPAAAVRATPNFTG